MNSPSAEKRFVVYVEHAVVHHQRKQGWVRHVLFWTEALRQFYHVWQSHQTHSVGYTIDHAGSLQLFTASEACTLKERLLREDARAQVVIFELVQQP